MEERKAKLHKMVAQYPMDPNRWFCRLCDSLFTRKVSAIDHVQAIHVRLLDYPCCYCQEHFTCHSQRRRHVHAQHREQNKLAKLLTD